MTNTEPYITWMLAVRYQSKIFKNFLTLHCLNSQDISQAFPGLLSQKVSISYPNLKRPWPKFSKENTSKAWLSLQKVIWYFNERF